uniref:Uracil phosphoribosyltransferase n=1 Tax=Apoglossum ruscifolium TaxID=167976 RepID=A0A4D6WM62_9FLOR|nr:hypothetical protein [Apoglossum ruscifolium]
MLLNIYLISHPIIKILSNSITYLNNNQTINEYNYKYLGLFLIYEIMRKHISLKSIYINKISYIKEISILDSNIEYYIITNLLNTHYIIGDIKILIPNINIINITNNIESMNDQIKEQINYLNKNKKIIILDNILDQSWTMILISNLINELNINTNSINIACLACYNQILDNIGQKYPQLNIYTTKII